MCPVIAIAVCALVNASANTTSCSNYSRNARTLIYFSACSGLVLRVIYALTLPDYYAPDEHAHINFIRYLATNWELPVQTNLTGSSLHDWEYYQPPLYYTLLALLKTAFDFIGISVHDVTFYRLTSIFFWVCSIWWAAIYLQHIKIDEWKKVFIFAIHCLLPAYIASSSAVNNDNLTIPLFSAFFLLELSKPESTKKTLMSGALIGCIFWAKLTAVIAIFFFIARRIQDQNSKTFTSKILEATAGVALVCVIWSPIALRNYLTYGSLTGEEIANVPRHWDTQLQGLLATFRYITFSFWATAGVYNNIKGNFYLLGAAITALSIAGWIRYLRFGSKMPHQIGTSTQAPFYFALLVNFILVLRFGLKYDQGQGRFLFPMLTAIGLFLAEGLSHLKGGKSPSMNFIRAALFAVTVWAATFLTYAITKASSATVTLSEAINQA